MERKILFTTSYLLGKPYDYFGENTRTKLFRFTLPRTCSYGLRFIKENNPEIEILEYPSWEEYTEKIKNGDYDIVGFSFYFNEIPEIIKMIAFARKYGVKNIWGGNYGVLTKDIEKYFDKIFVGYPEQEIARVLNKQIEDIRHPVLINYIGTNTGLKVVAVGILFTTRGCTMKCKFCQTPYFQPDVNTISLHSIEEVLIKYHNLGIRDILIFDENFGLKKGHTENVVNLLNKYHFYWQVFSRPDILAINFEEWRKKGMIGVLTGIENMHQENLDFVDKGTNLDNTIELIEKMSRENIFIIGSYVIGFENETVESIKNDMGFIKKLNLDLYQICVLTPLPRTPLWDNIENRYGIFEKDYHKYDAKHLVWNHPNIKPEEMENILESCFKTVYTRKRPFQTALKFYRKYSENRNVLCRINYILSMFIRANKFNYKI